MHYKIIRTFFIVILIACNAIEVSAVSRKLSPQEAAQIVKKIADWYKDTERYTMDIEIKTFKEYSSDAAHETQHGFTRKSGRNFHSFMLGTNSIQNEKYQITIDSARNFMSVKDAELNVWENISAGILEKYLNAATEITLVETGNDYILKMAPPVNSAMHQYELTYDKNYRIKNIKMEIEKEELAEDGKTTYLIHPKIIFRFYNYTNGASLKSAEFLTETYINTGAELTPKSEYAGFEFFDLRVKEKLKN
jgi:hypothetical protein